ncbi:MAG: oligoribonuclease [Bdellovibrionaceae bacterium]|nr:oligoribonuclease [Bdellovibrionales bacterium]MCB9083138.1 oligoribonuclease [Pseudobdellovibrionaceae bacterium]
MEHMLWLDMEMTGLDVNKEVPIEVAAVITNKKLESLETYHAVIRQPQHYLDNMDDWNKSHHGDSGLTAMIPSGKEPDLVENDLIDLANRFWSDEKVVLCGNSIGQDRLFIDKYFSRFAEKLHYRMLDVTAFKLIFNNFYNQKFEKQNTHRATDDIQESINELKFYLSFIRT